MSIFEQRSDRGYDEILFKDRQERMMLYRAGDVIQKVFNLYQKSKWDLEFYKVERVKDTSYQLDDNPVEKCDALYLYKSPVRPTMMGFLAPFPHTLFRDREEESALAYLSSHDSIMSMHSMVETILQGVCSKVEEVVVEPKNCRLRLIVVTPDGKQDLRHISHELFRVTNRNGEMFALDVTGAQYGYYEPVVPWVIYQRERIASINKIVAFGDVPKFTIFRTCRDELYDEILRCARPALTNALRNWQSRNDLALNRLLTFADADFVRTRDELFVQVAADLRRLIPAAYKSLISTMTAGGLERSLAALAGR
ncbi:hypothetical protein MMC07_003467 [Pseudocyphellaria aurata]|nr:hypothetical protein [Pseudocyphellaria aurata]